MAEGAGLLNRYTVKSRIGGSNPPLSASFQTPDNSGVFQFQPANQCLVKTNPPLFGVVCRCQLRAALDSFSHCSMNRRAENIILITAKLEGGHHAAMREINAELGI